MQLRYLLPALLLLGAGCASVPRPCAPLGDPLGAAPLQNKAADQTCLQGYQWRSAAPPRGVVVIVHGIRDHALRYRALADALTAQGLVVFAQDMRGHGRSGGPRQRFDSLEQLVGDTDLLVSAARAQYPGLQVFMYGHSLGGLITTEYALAHPERVDGVILSGAALRLLPGVGALDRTAARFFAVVAPGLEAQEVDDTDFVRAPQAKSELAQDPLVDHGNLPAASAGAVVGALDTLPARLAEPKMPLLIMHGTVDKATNPEGSKALYVAASSPDKTLKLWEGLYHDLLHEPERDQVIQTTVTWIVEHLR